MTAWFEQWFDTDYYHLLYQNRSNEEAIFFIENLNKKGYLNNGRFLDLACGKGRFCKALSKYPHQNIVGLDLSLTSIKEAKKLNLPKFIFEEHDMRQAISHKPFDRVFNMFTSFGYFEDEKTDVIILQNIYNILKKGGYLILDYLNTSKASSQILANETKEIEGVSFKIHRYLSGDFICKEIEVLGEQHFVITEKVKKFSLSQLKYLLEQQGFLVCDIWGDYNLSPYESNISDRMIFFAKK